MKKRWQFFAALIVLVVAVALHTGRLFGFRVSAPAGTFHNLADGTEETVSTLESGTDIKGYAGPLPLEVTFRSDTVVAVTILENSETPGFLKRVENGMLPSFVGLTAREVLDNHIDGVTNATFSSNALRENMKLAATEYLRNHGEAVDASAATTAESSEALAAGFYATFAVVLLSAIFPLFFHNKAYRIVQMVLNLAVTGVWTATMLNYTQFTNILSGGIALAMGSAVLILMLIVAFIYPLFRRPQHYCSWTCPLGSAQELAGHLNPRFKIQVSPKAAKILSLLRNLLWAVLLLLMVSQVWYNWFDYELFSVFAGESASLFVIVASVVFLLLSLFVSRPYCRFVCPTGSTFKAFENTVRRANAVTPKSHKA